MQFKSIIDSPCGIRYAFDTLELQSGMARRLLLETSMMCSAKEIDDYFRRLRIFHDTFVSKTENKTILQTLQFRLKGLRDINGTLKRLDSSTQLDDIELFEVKYLALLSEDVSAMLQELEMVASETVDLPNLQDVVSLLDPDGLKIASFYIYDSYSTELRTVREKMKKKPEMAEQLFEEAIAIEDKIRADLSNKLKKHVSALKSSLLGLTNIDIFIAKAIQIQQFGLCFPEISKNGNTKFTGLFNTEIKTALAENKKAYQPVDIEFCSIPTIIIGANMGGKTVTLKTLTLSQFLFQFGFGISAQKAVVDVKDEIHFCIGDEQSSTKELSSFAAEMKRIDNVIKTTKSGKKIIALIDEPARTTNPIEGTALVSALIKILKERNMSLLMTTHYNIDVTGCKCLRVKGLENGKMNYALIEAKNGEVPHEALNIAESLGIDENWIFEAKRILEKND